MIHVGLIGYGAFGKALTAWLQDSCEFTVYDRAQELSSVEEALAQPIVIFNIPAQNLEEFFVTNKALLRDDALYIDVCSVKVKPVEVMQAHLPAGARIIATHPLFGPQSAAGGLVGHKIMTHPVRVTPDEYATFTGFLSELGLRSIDTTPELHDQAMAYSQGLSHYIGRVMKCMNAPATELATQAYEDLLDMKRIQGNDSDALYASIVQSNPYTQPVIDAFGEACREIDQRFHA